jgi:hypothetical protein
MVVLDEVTAFRSLGIVDAEVIEAPHSDVEILCTGRNAPWSSLIAPTTAVTSPRLGIRTTSAWRVVRTSNERSSGHRVRSRDGGINTERCRSTSGAPTTGRGSIPAFGIESALGGQDDRVERHTPLSMCSTGPGVGPSRHVDRHHERARRRTIYETHETRRRGHETAGHGKRGREDDTGGHDSTDTRVPARRRHIEHIDRGVCVFVLDLEKEKEGRNRWTTRRGQCGELFSWAVRVDWRLSW